MNIILDGLPKAVKIDGAAVKINTDFRVCLKILRAFEDERLTDSEKLTVLVTLLYPEIPENTALAISQGLKFLNVGKEPAMERAKLPQSYCLTANYAGATLKNTLERHQRTMVAEPVRIGDIGSAGQAHRVYSVRGKSVALSTGRGGQGSGTGLYEIDLPDGDYIIRKLSPVECERLQTLPDGYTDCVSNAQRYKCLGNGWTVDVISHILGALPRDF